MAEKTALLLIADESANLDLVTALGRLGINSVCLKPQEPPPADTEKTLFDYVFIDESHHWSPEQLAYTGQVKQASGAMSIALLSQDNQAAEAIPASDAYRSAIPSSLEPIDQQLQVDQTKTALQLSEQKYRVLFNAMREGLVLHEIVLNERGNPADFRYIDVNPVFERMTGLQHEELVGKLLSQTPLWYDADWPDDYLKVARSGKPYRVEIFIPELDRHFDIVAFRPQAGQCAAIISDITVRKVHEKEIEGVAKHSSALRSVETPSEITRATLHQINEFKSKLTGR